MRIVLLIRALLLPTYLFHVGLGTIRSLAWLSTLEGRDSNDTVPYCYEIEVVPIGKPGLSVTHQLHVIIL